MNYRLAKLREVFKEKKIDAMLITNPTNRRYITGFTGSAGYALVTQEKAFFITDFRYIEQAKKQAPNFEIIIHKEEIVDTVSTLLKDNKVEQPGFEQDYVTYSLYKQFVESFHNIRLIPLSHTIENLRMLKDSNELQLIKKAAEIADEAFQYILSIIKPGMIEKAVSLALEFKMRELGADGVAFETIVASGHRSSLPHGIASDKEIETGDFVTIDFGASYQGYNSDITRTIVIGKPNDKQKEIYDIVYEAQLAGVNNIRAYLTGKEADAFCRDIINKYGYGDFFGHGTGHGLGLDVHEKPSLNYRNDTILAPGMVVTVEPGIYIPDFGGVRIEDDVLITESGLEILTHSTKALINI